MLLLLTLLACDPATCSSRTIGDCAEVQTCCSQTDCYYLADDTRIDCDGTDCSAAAEEVVSTCGDTAGDTGA